MVLQRTYIDVWVPATERYYPSQSRGLPRTKVPESGGWKPNFSAKPNTKEPCSILCYLALRLRMQPDKTICGLEPNARNFCRSLFMQVIIVLVPPRVRGRLVFQHQQ